MERVKDNVENELSKIGHGTLIDINQYQITHNATSIKGIDLEKMCADVNEVLGKNVENSRDAFPTLFRNDRCATVTHMNAVKASLSVLDQKMFAFSKKAAILAKKEPRHFLKSQKKPKKPKIRRVEQPEHLYEEPEEIHEEPDVNFEMPVLDTIDIDVNLFARRKTAYDGVLSRPTAAQPTEPDLNVRFEEVDKLKATNTLPLCCRISDVHFTDVIKKTSYFPAVLLDVNSLPLWTEPVAEVAEEKINCFRKLVNEAYDDLPVEIQKSINYICFKEFHEELLTETVFNDVIREITSPGKSAPASTSGNLLVTMKSIGDEVEVSFADVERLQFQTPRPIQRVSPKQRQDFLLTTPQHLLDDISASSSPLEFTEKQLNDLGNIVDAAAGDVSAADLILPVTTEILQQPRLAANSPRSDDSEQIVHSIVRKKTLMAHLLNVIPRTARELLELIKPKLDAGEEVMLQTLFPHLNRFALLELYTICLELPIMDNRIRIKQEKASKEYPIYVVRH